jgi:hypothetical protein
MPGTGIRTIVKRRAKGRCERCAAVIPRIVERDKHTGKETSRLDHSFHHRYMRRHGGVDAVANLIYLCLPCHREIHRDEHWAEAFGWIAMVDADLTPVRIHHNFWAVLTFDGWYERIDHDDAAHMLDWLDTQQLAD